MILSDSLVRQATPAMNLMREVDSRRRPVLFAVAGAAALWVAIRCFVFIYEEYNRSDFRFTDRDVARVAALSYWVLFPLAAVALYSWYE